MDHLRRIRPEDVGYSCGPQLPVGSGGHLITIRGRSPGAP